MGLISRLKLGFCFGVFAAALCVSAGCGGGSDGRAKVKGHVKFFDKDLTTGTVAFTSKDGIRVGSSVIDFNGNYEISDAPIGEVTITVKVPTIPKMGQAKEKPKPPPGVPAAMMPGSAADDTSFVPSSIDPSKIVQIPGKYGSVDTSGLTFTVVKGSKRKTSYFHPDSFMAELRYSSFIPS